MIRTTVFARTGWLLLLAGASLTHAQDWSPVRKPLGVYVHVDVGGAIKGYPGPGTPTDAQLHAYLRSLYAEVLADPAISGITAGVHWDAIQVADPFCSFDRTCAFGSDGYDWSYVDDFFAEANAFHKSVQLIITPGTDSPSWLLAQLPTCDGLFSAAGTAPANCGKATFIDFPEAQRADGNPPVLPLPWNGVYMAAWQDFLVHLNARYNSNPAFVSIALAGPVCASDEIILPTTANGSFQASGVEADKAWNTLIEHSFPFVSSYRNSDQAFIDAWKRTIDAYERIFSGVTLFLSPDAGNDLPEFPVPLMVHSDNTLWAVDCPSATASPMSCEAKTEILSYFVRAQGPNGKSTQVGGMTASSAKTPGAIGIAGVKVLTALWPPPSPAFVGGAEFDKPVSTPADPQQQGCPQYPGKNCNGLTVEEAAYNTLNVFFYDTPVAAYYGGTVGTSPIQYVEIDYQDIIYAQTNLCPTLPSKVPGQPSLEDLLNRASYDLFAMAGQPSFLPPPTCR